jgi:flagellar basal body-associated protein FliL
MARDSENSEGKSKLKFFKSAKAQPEQPAPDAGGPGGGAAVATAVASEAAAVTPEAAAEAASPTAAQAEPSQPDFSQPEIPVVRKRVGKRERPQMNVSLGGVFAASLALAVRALVILAVIAAGAVAAALVVSKVIGPMVAKAQVAEVRKQIEQITITAGPEEAPKGTAKAGGGGEGHKAKGKGGGHGSGAGVATEIKDLVVNPAGTDGTRYVCATVSLEASTAQAAEEVSARESQVRDRLIAILGARTVPELSSLEVREDLRDEIRKAVDDLITQGKIEAVYFSNFVLQ